MHESIITTIKFLQHFIYLTEWFQQQTEFTTEFEAMEVKEMNKCLFKVLRLTQEEQRDFLQLREIVCASGHVISAQSCSMTNKIKFLCLGISIIT